LTSCGNSFTFLITRSYYFAAQSQDLSPNDWPKRLGTIRIYADKGKTYSSLGINAFGPMNIRVTPAFQAHPLANFRCYLSLGSSFIAVVALPAILKPQPT